MSQEFTRKTFNLNPLEKKLLKSAYEIAELEILETERAKKAAISKMHAVANSILKDQYGFEVPEGMMRYDNPVEGVIEVLVEGELPSWQKEQGQQAPEGSTPKAPTSKASKRPRQGNTKQRAQRSQNKKPHDPLSTSPQKSSKSKTNKPSKNQRVHRNGASSASPNGSAKPRSSTTKRGE